MHCPPLRQNTYSSYSHCKLLRLIGESWQMLPKSTGCRIAAFGSDSASNVPPALKHIRLPPCIFLIKWKICHFNFYTFILYALSNFPPPVSGSFVGARLHANGCRPAPCIPTVVSLASQDRLPKYCSEIRYSELVRRVVQKSNLRDRIP